MKWPKLYKRVDLLLFSLTVNCKYTYKLYIVNSLFWGVFGLKMSPVAHFFTIFSHFVNKLIVKNNL